jgi:hypothetical protein
MTMADQDDDELTEAQLVAKLAAIRRQKPRVSPFKHGSPKYRAWVRDDRDREIAEAQAADAEEAAAQAQKAAKAPAAKAIAATK